MYQGSSDSAPLLDGAEFPSGVLIYYWVFLWRQSSSSAVSQCNLLLDSATRFSGWTELSSHLECSSISGCYYVVNRAFWLCLPTCSWFLLSDFLASIELFGCVSLPALGFCHQIFWGQSSSSDMSPNLLATSDIRLSCVGYDFFIFISSGALPSSQAVVLGFSPPSPTSLSQSLPS